MIRDNAIGNWGGGGGLWKDRWRVHFSAAPRENIPAATTHTSSILHPDMAAVATHPACINIALYSRKDQCGEVVGAPRASRVQNSRGKPNQNKQPTVGHAAWVTVATLTNPHNTRQASRTPGGILTIPISVHRTTKLQASVEAPSQRQGRMTLPTANQQTISKAQR